MKKRNKKGFTLVECIVAIAIITMFSTVAITVFQTTIKTTNDQWNKFQVLQMGENVLSCFESSDGFSDFERHMGDIKGVGEQGISKVTLTPDTHDEFDFSTTPSSIPFTKMRAYENEKKVEFFNNETVISTFSYDDANIYEKDVHGQNTSNNDALDKLNLYSTEPEIVPEIKECAEYYVAYSNETRTSKSYLSNYRKKVYVNIDGENANYKNIDESLTDTIALNDFEKYLYQKKWYLRPVEKGDGKTSTNPGYLICDVYNFDGTQVKDSRSRTMQIKFTLYFKSGKNYSASDSYDRWKTDPAVISKIESRYKGYSLFIIDIPDTDWQDVKNDSNKTFVGTSYSILSKKFEWKGLPYILFANVSNSDTKDKDTYFKFTYTPGQAAGLKYTDYTLKSEYVSQIGYALVSGTSAKLYNGSDASAKMIFSYTGNDCATPLNNLEFVNKGKDANGFDAYYKTLDSVEVVKADYNDSKKTINFLDRDGNVSVFFTYKNEDTYNQDKGDICNSDGAFNKYYYKSYNLQSGRYDYYLNKYKLENKTGKVLIRKATDSNGLMYFQLVVGEEPIFVSYADTIGIKDSSNMNNSFAKFNNNNEQIEEVVSAATKYYYYSVGRHVMVARATFSQYVGSSETEPKIKIWIMTSDNFNLWKTLNSSVVPEEPENGDLFVSYRKG